MLEIGADFCYNKNASPAPFIFSEGRKENVLGLSFDDYKDELDLTPYPRPEPLKDENEKTTILDTLLKFVLRERGMIAAFSATYEKKRELFRGYMNEREALPVPQEILSLQDRLFWTETLERGIVDVGALARYPLGISLFEGDITRLNADGIVNAANRTLLGCFLAGHNCIDNVIHSRAGMQLRADCAKIIALQRQEEETGDAKITRAYNLPSKYVLHTVGPMVGRKVTSAESALLRSCYLSCLDLAESMKLNSLAFCCVSTGVFNFPGEEAAEIATGAVVSWKLKHPESLLNVIFNTFLKKDTEIYQNILKMI